MENYNFNLGVNPAPANQRGRVWRIFGAVVALAIVAFLIVYSGGMENILKLLGVGASGIYEISISSTRHFVGDAEFFVTGTQPELDGVTVLDQFSGTPQDTNLTEQGRGFAAAIFSSPQDPANELYKDHTYTSAVIDLTLATPLLSAVEVTDFNSADSTISYAYRSSAQASSIQLSPWLPLDPSVINSETADGVKVRTAIIEQNVERFVQIKFTFNNVDPMNRNAVYAVSLQYKAGEATPGGMTGDNVTDREISIHYQTTNAPEAADIDIVSADLDNRVVYTEKQIDLSERISYTFTTALSPGAYALVVSGPTFETQIIPFEVMASDEQIRVDLASFSSPTGQVSGYDLNGDGKVNTLDLTILMGQFTQ